MLARCDAAPWAIEGLKDHLDAPTLLAYAVALRYQVPVPRS